jgi:hypothetical protein
MQPLLPWKGDHSFAFAQATQGNLDTLNSVHSIVRKWDNIDQGIKTFGPGRPPWPFFVSTLAVFEATAACISSSKTETEHAVLTISEHRFVYEYYCEDAKDKRIFGQGVVPVQVYLRRLSIEALAGDFLTHLAPVLPL